MTTQISTKVLFNQRLSIYSYGAEMKFQLHLKGGKLAAMSIACFVLPSPPDEGGAHFYFQVSQIIGY